MSEEGKRIEFGDKGPYLFDVLDGEVQGMLLEDHEVCLLQFGQVYLPVRMDVCAAMADGLSNMSQAEIGPEKEGMIPVALDQEDVMELPLLTGAASEAFQHGETVYMDVQFGNTDARLCFTIIAAATVGQVLSQVPKP